ncbi:MAG: shikimate dehydrogenase [Candidatus Bathyarchaeota archaeon]|nr:shikimate dehydrogenase [Candidatus Bathyarchaeota archaeon]MDH5531880.1 shikimate dehydrogenase [Candidatus Bathyarchaeota archaeon]MDH5712747.1 shikimate dehydrogenase [Candidatus Bathyarchaeota archaeon]
MRLWGQFRTKISGRTKVCCVIGDPIEHTLSPVIHNAAFEELNLDFVYLAFRVRREELRDAIAGAKSLDIHGLNVTMPHKTAVMEHLDEIDSTSRSIGAVNTILNAGGRLVGYITDGVGAINALKENGVGLEGKKMLLLGAGGAGKAIAFNLAQEVEELKILNRTTQKAKELAEVLRKKFNKKVSGNSLSSELLKNELEEADILVNATSVGMHPDVHQSLVDPSWLRPDLCVMDLIYNPLETKLAKDAKSMGAKVVSGIEMLVYQGAASFEIWTNHPAPVKVMKQAVLNKLSELGTLS